MDGTQLWRRSNYVLRAMVAHYPKRQEPLYKYVLRAKSWRKHRNNLCISFFKWWHCTQWYMLEPIAPLSAIHIIAPIHFSSHGMPYSMWNETLGHKWGNLWIAYFPWTSLGARASQFDIMCFIQHCLGLLSTHCRSSSLPTNIVHYWLQNSLEKCLNIESHYTYYVKKFHFWPHKSYLTSQEDIKSMFILLPSLPLSHTHLCVCV